MTTRAARAYQAHQAVAKLAILGCAALGLAAPTETFDRAAYYRAVNVAPLSDAARDHLKALAYFSDDAGRVAISTTEIAAKLKKDPRTAKRRVAHPPPPPVREGEAPFPRISRLIAGGYAALCPPPAAPDPSLPTCTVFVLRIPEGAPVGVPRARFRAAPGVADASADSGDGHAAAPALAPEASTPALTGMTYSADDRRDILAALERLALVVPGPWATESYLEEVLKVGRGKGKSAALICGAIDGAAAWKPKKAWLKNFGPLRDKILITFVPGQYEKTVKVAARASAAAAAPPPRPSGERVAAAPEAPLRLHVSREVLAVAAGLGVAPPPRLAIPPARRALPSHVEAAPEAQLDGTDPTPTSNDDGARGPPS